MKTLYLDCFSGISGDMFLGALLDLGIVSKDDFISEMQKLGLDEVEFEIKKVSKNAISATDVNVIVKNKEHAHSHRHNGHSHGRSMADIAVLIDNSGLSDSIKKTAKAIFMRLAKAEAKIHNQDPNDVHFHEVGAVDSIADIVGAAVLLFMLKIDRVVCSELYDGYGFTSCQHGLIPIPVPATLHLLTEAGAKIKKADIQSELITPTGAAIASELANQFGEMPALKNARIGYGAGKKDFKTPNLLRVVLGEEQKLNTVFVIEANIDDTTGENAGYAAEKLLLEGALDVYYTPIFMKKNRPAYMLGVICAQADFDRIKDIILRHTTTIGLRYHKADRVVMDRETKEADTPFGKVSYKLCRHNDIIKLVPEYEDLKRICNNCGKAFDEVYTEVKSMLNKIYINREV